MSAKYSRVGQESDDEKEVFGMVVIPEDPENLLSENEDAGLIPENISSEATTVEEGKKEEIKLTDEDTKASSGDGSSIASHEIDEIEEAGKTLGEDEVKFEETLKCFDEETQMWDVAVPKAGMESDEEGQLIVDEGDNSSSSSSSSEDEGEDKANKMNGKDQIVTVMCKQTICIENLHPDVTEDLIRAIFGKIGVIKEIHLHRDTEITAGRWASYAFVKYHHQYHAITAINTLNRSRLLGKRMEIFWAENVEYNKETLVRISNIDKRANSSLIYDTFSPFGRLLNCRLLTNSEGYSQGIAFVLFESENSADRCIQVTKNLKFFGKSVIVRKVVKCQILEDDKVKYRVPFNSGFYVLIENLDRDIDDSSIYKHFSKFGKLTSHKVPRQNGISRGYAFISYQYAHEACNSIDLLHGKYFGKNIIFVSIALTKLNRKEYKNYKRNQQQDCAINSNSNSTSIPALLFYLSEKKTSTGAIPKYPKIHEDYKISDERFKEKEIQTIQPILKTSNYKQFKPERKISATHLQVAKQTNNLHLKRRQLFNNILKERLAYRIQPFYPNTAQDITNKMLTIASYEIITLLKHPEKLKALAREAKQVLSCNKLL